LYFECAEWMTEYQQAARMSALQPWELLLRWCHAWNIFVYVEKEKTFERTNLVMGLQHTLWWCYGVRYKSLTGTMKRGQFYNVIHLIKFLYKLSGHTHLLWQMLPFQTLVNFPLKWRLTILLKELKGMRKGKLVILADLLPEKNSIYLNQTFNNI